METIFRIRNFDIALQVTMQIDQIPHIDKLLIASAQIETRRNIIKEGSKS